MKSLWFSSMRRSWPNFCAIVMHFFEKSLFFVLWLSRDAKPRFIRTYVPLAAAIGFRIQWSVMDFNPYLWLPQGCKEGLILSWPRNMCLEE